eukprot:394146_1
MGNTLFRCFCGCCMNSTEEYAPLVQQKSVYYGENTQANRFVKCKLDLESILNDDIPEELQNQLRMLRGMLEMHENIANKSDEKSSGYQQLADHEEKIVPDQAKNKVEFNNYDDNININNDVLLIFGYIRDAQNSLSSDIAHHIVPQTVINMICNYCLKPNQSIFKIRLNFMKDKPLMSVSNAANIACNVKQVWVNGSSLFFLSPNDHIYVSGSNYKGTLGINSSADWQSSLKKPQTTRFYQENKFKIVSSSSCRTEHSIAVTLNNKIYGFGYNGYYGQFGVENPSVKNSYTAKGLIDARVEVFWPTLINIDTKYKIVDIRIGSEHSLFLTNNGKVLGCGNGDNKRLGTNYSASSSSVSLIKSLSNDTIIKIRCGEKFSLVLTDNGILKSFGKNDEGQLGIGKVEKGWGSGHKPVIVEVAESSEPKITTMECGSAHSCCLDEFGNIYCWGKNYQGQCGQYPALNAHSIPKPICLELKGIKILNIACGTDYTIAMDHEMNLYAFGECDSNTRYWNNERADTSRIHVAKYHEFQNLIDSKKIIDIKAGKFGDVYLCVANH